MIDRETIYEMFEAMEDTNEAIGELEKVVGCTVELDGPIFASFNYMPALMEKLAFPEGAQDEVLDRFYSDFWRVVDGYSSAEEFYNTWFKAIWEMVYDEYCNNDLEVK